MKFIIWIYLIPTILSLPFHDNEDCWTINNNTITNKYAVLVNFSPKFNDKNDSCSVQISNPWSADIQNGFGVFVPHSMDCSSIVIIECLPSSTFSKQTIPSVVQLTCHTNSSEVEMSCSSIGLTFKQNNNNIQLSKKSINVQVVALAKEPCLDGDILFPCPKDYSHSCIDRKLRCNGRLECPSGDDERGCHHSSSSGMRIFKIILAGLAVLFFIFIVTIVLICCCCYAACNAIIHRFHPGKNGKGEIVGVTGEDAGLMKSLTTPNVIEVLPQQHIEPATLVIDSTKPVYPRLE